MVLLTKRVAFSASHYYWLNQWSEEQNKAVFGLCANRFGHGHNYLVDVCVAGPVDPQTGMVINFFDLLPLLDNIIVQPLDHRNLNEEIAYFQTHVPTLEQIALFLWPLLHQAIEQQGLTLDNIKVIENQDLEVMYHGSETVLLTRKYGFSAAHKLWNEAMSEADNLRCFGPCTRLHGHNYMLEITVAGTPDAETGMVVPLTALDPLIQETVLTPMDHHWLDEEVAFLNGTLSTVENVAQVLYEILKTKIPSPATLHRVRLYESDQNWAEVGVQEGVTL